MAKVAKPATTSKSKPKSKTQAQTRMFADTLSRLPRPQISPFLAAFAGVVAAVPLTVAAMMPLVHQDITSAVSQASKSVAMKTAADNLDCSQPTLGGASTGSSSGGGMGHVLGENTTQTPGGGQGGGSQQTPPPFVQHMVGGGLTSNGTISGIIGAGATATVSSVQTETTKIYNDTTINASSHNDQDVSSGNATSSYNTGSGGNASTGDATASNSVEYNFNVKNN